MKTANGIYLKLNESEYKVLKFGLIFYFSSKLYADKFLKTVDNYITEETIKIKNKYQINGNFDVYLSLSYYKKIEKRGFYVFDDIEKFEIKENIMFANVIIK